MKRPIALCVIVVITLAVAWGAVLDLSDEHVELAILSEQNWEQIAPRGKEVDAIYGDIVLRNQHLTAVIAQPLATRNANMTVRDVAGALIDLTTRDSASDQLSAFYPGRRTYPYREWSIAVDGNAESDPPISQTFTSTEAAVIVSARAAENRPAVETTYHLQNDAHYLTITTAFSNTGNKPLTVPLEDDIRADGGKEEMLKSPNGEADLFWIHDQYWRQAYGVLGTPGTQIQSNSDARNSVLKYSLRDVQDSVVLAPGQSYKLTRHVFPGRNLPDVKAIAGDLRNQKSHRVHISIQDEAGQSLPRARLALKRDGKSFGTVEFVGPHGVTTRLPAGQFEVSVSSLGTLLLRGAAIEVDENEDGNQFEVKLRRKLGFVRGRLTDGHDRPLACKVEFRGKGDTPTPDFGPESAVLAVKNLRYAPRGEFTQALPSGQYDVIISHGPEYDALFTELTVTPGQTVDLTGQLKRSVQTPGWISSDFHSHSSPSGDNTSEQRGRVVNLVCEHIEFAPCTEHNRVSTYEPHIEALGIADQIATVSGIELTGRPLPLNHQNAFPLIHKPRTQDGGGPVTDVDPERQIERLALWDNNSEKLIQQNHPDIGWLFYDSDGDGTPDSGFDRAFPHMDVIEIHPISNALLLEPFETLPGRKGNNRVFNWLQLLNQGFRIAGVVNTDAHYNFHGSGGLRNWIRSTTDDPARIDAMEMVRAAEHGRMIMSNGPYLEVSLSETGNRKSVSAGEDLTALSGNVTLEARVQCANWLDIDRVFVLVNGRVHPRHNYTRDDHPNRFRNGVVKFDEKLTWELASDAHIVVVAGGEKSVLGPVAGPSWGKQQPTAVSNPIFVDVDGNGFRPNRDTLGHPLPVRFDSR